MSTNIQLNKLFNCSVPLMLSNAEIKRILYSTDKGLFEAYDPGTFTPTYEDDFESAIEAGRRFISDETIVDQLKGETEEVKLAVKSFEPYYQDLKYFVKKAYPDKKNIWNEFGFDNYHNAIKSVPRFLCFLDELAIIAQNHSVDLIAAGYTQLKIDAIHTYYNTISDEHNSQGVFKKQRNIITGTRIGIMNNVFSKVVELNHASKIIFRDNPIKLSQYLLPRQGNQTNQLSFTVSLVQSPSLLFSIKGSYDQKIHLYWGDGDSAEYTMEGLTAINPQHTYSVTGMFDINMRNKIGEITDLDISLAKISSIDLPANMHKLKNLNLSGNNIENSDDIDQILNNLNNSPVEPGSINLSGGTNAAPSRAGILTKIMLEEKGWSVAVN